jgi:hypothetical protein
VLAYYTTERITAVVSLIVQDPQVCVKFQGSVIFLFEKRSSLQTPTFFVPFRKVVGIVPRRPRRRRIQSRRRKYRRLDLKNKSRSNRRIADLEIVNTVDSSLRFVFKLKI